jgi:hypothetical protein
MLHPNHYHNRDRIRKQPLRDDGASAAPSQMMKKNKMKSTQIPSQTLPNQNPSPIDIINDNDNTNTIDTDQALPPPPPLPQLAPATQIIPPSTQTKNSFSNYQKMMICGISKILITFHSRGIIFFRRS